MPLPNFHWHLLETSPGDALWRNYPNAWPQAVVDCRFMLNPTTFDYEYNAAKTPEDAGVNAARAVQKIATRHASDFAASGRAFSYHLNFIGVGNNSAEGSTPFKLQPDQEFFAEDQAAYMGDNYPSLYYQGALRALSRWSNRMSSRLKRELTARSLPSPTMIVGDIEVRGDITTNGFGGQFFTNASGYRQTPVGGGMVEISLADARATTLKQFPTLVQTATGERRLGDRKTVREMWTAITDDNGAYFGFPSGYINERNPVNQKWADASQSLQTLRYAGLLADGWARYLMRDFPGVPIGEWSLLAWGRDAEYLAEPGANNHMMYGRFPLQIQIPVWYMGFGQPSNWSLQDEAANPAPAGSWGTLPNWITYFGLGGSTPNEQFRRMSLAWAKVMVRNAVRAAPFTKVMPSISAIGNNPFGIANAQFDGIADFRDRQYLRIPKTATGQFKIVYNGLAGSSDLPVQTNNLSVTASPATIKAALEAFTGIGAGNVDVLGNGMTPGTTDGNMTIILKGAMHLVAIKGLGILDGTTPVSGGPVTCTQYTFNTTGGYYYQIQPSDIAEVVIYAAGLGVTDYYVFQDSALTTYQSQFWRDTLDIVNASLGFTP